ncbi:hypothetical protein J1N35_034399, partial [Gossypium stocksii]
MGHTLVLEKLLTTRNIFQYCFEGNSCNGFRVADLMYGANPRRLMSTDQAWLYGVDNDLALVLTGKMREPNDFPTQSIRCIPAVSPPYQQVTEFFQLLQTRNGYRRKGRQFV